MPNGRPRQRLALLVSPMMLAVSLLAGGCGDGTETDAAGAGGGGGSVPTLGAVEDFATLPASSEGLAFGRDAADQPVLYVGSGDRLVSVAKDGTVTEIADVAAPVGVAVMQGGDVLVCGKTEGTNGELVAAVWRVSPSGDKSLFIAPGQVSFGLTNFIAVAPDGSVVLSDSKADKVYRAASDGAGVELVTDGITYPNGMAFSKDGATLFVASWDSKQLFALPRLDGGGYGPPEVFADGVENVDGIAVFESGDLLLVQSGDGLVRLRAGGGREVVAPGTAFGLPANAAFGAGEFGEGWAYVTNLLGPQLRRAYVGEAGAEMLTQ